MDVRLTSGNQAQRLTLEKRMKRVEERKINGWSVLLEKVKSVGGWFWAWKATKAEESSKAGRGGPCTNETICGFRGWADANTVLDPIEGEDS